MWLDARHFRQATHNKNNKDYFMSAWAQENEAHRKNEHQQQQKTPTQKKRECEFDAQVASISTNIIRVGCFFSLSCFLGAQHHDVNDEYALIFYSLVIITLQLKQWKWEIVKWISFFFFFSSFYSFLSNFFLGA